MASFVRHAHRPLRLVAALALAAGMLAALTIAPATAKTAAPKLARPAPAVRTTADTATSSKLDASLADNVEANDTSTVRVMVFAKKGAGAPKDLLRPMRLRLKAEKQMEVYVGWARNAKLVKLATADGVIRVEDNSPTDPPVLPDVKKRSAAEVKAAAAKAKAAITRATELGVVERWAATFDSQGRSTSTPLSLPLPNALEPGGAAPTGWMDIGDANHKSAAAWANGYTGEGVTVGVADTGVDFAHPDLQGTQATVTDASSPYFGWPLAYDPYSILLYANDVDYGTSYVTGGYSWFSDTSAVVTRSAGGTASFDGKTYTLPDVSESGDYHMGYHNDDWLTVLGYNAVLVTDENTAGVYDTVRVDLNGNRNFADDKPCTKASPLSYIDFWDSLAGDEGADGYADMSGGMLYWIADGANQPPGYDLHFAPSETPDSGDLVCFMGSMDAYDTHGTLCASNIVGQGVVDGASVNGEYPSFAGAGTGGIVKGAGKDAALAGVGNVYNANAAFVMAYDFAAFGLDGLANSGDELQALSCSFGYSEVDNDGWDYESRYVTQLNDSWSDDTVFVFSTGNGAPGYGTVAPPSPSTGIAVGASTQFGSCGGWDSISSQDQVTVGDVIGWSNRGPGAMGDAGVNVVADGAYASGDVPLNDGAWDGWTSWEIWGGTSRSTPVVVGNLTLVQQAFKQAHGRWPNWQEARDLLMNGATDLSYDSFVQGAGMVDALRSTSLAAESDGVAVSPSAWTAGDYRGTARGGFANIVHPGDTDSQTFTVQNHGASSTEVSVDSVVHQRAWTETIDVVLDPADESDYDFSRPDYLYDLSGILASHGDPDLMVIKTAYPLSEMDPTAEMSGLDDDKNDVRVLAYDWTDQDTEGDLWTDGDSDGLVDAAEIDADEYMRFTYGYGRGTSHEIRVQHPVSRSHDGVYLGLQHRTRGGGGLVHVKVEVSGWNRVDWPWLSVADPTLTVGAGSTADIDAQLTVPQDAPIGIYEGQILVMDDSERTTVVPISVNVAADGASTTFGEPGAEETLMDNSRVFGYQDWNWRPESGDWRFFFADVDDSLSSENGDRLLVNTEWETTPTDIDTQVYGPVDRPLGWPNGDDAFWGPYDLGLKGGSVNTNLGDGRWGFQTGTGGAGEWVSAGLDEGLNEIMLHNVLYSGAQIGEQFSGRTGVVSCLPLEMKATIGAAGSTSPVSFSTGLDLPGLTASAFGLAPVRSWTANISTDETWVSSGFAVTNAPYLEVSCSGDSDIDLALEYWSGSSWDTVGVSATASGDESLRLDAPEPGTYRLSVYGYAVVAPVEQFHAEARAPDGSNITVSGVPAGAISKGTSLNLPVKLALPAGAVDGATYEGVVYLGIAAAPKLIEIPVTVVADLSAVPAPAGFTATKGFQSAALTWTNSGDYAATRILKSTTGYATSAGDTAGQTTVFDAAGTSFNATGLTESTTYYFTAFNRDVAGNWSAASKATVSFGIPAPAEFKATAGYKKVDLAWGNSGDYSATRILRSTTGYATSAEDVPGQTKVFDAAGTAWADTGLAAGTTYYYTAYNRDAAGNWSLAATASATAQGHATLSKPKLKPSKPTHGKKFKVSGSISPKHAAKTKVTLRFYRKVGSSYGKKPYKSVTVTVKAKASSYTTSVTLKKKGSYRVVAYHADAAHAASYSAKRSFKVK